MECAMNQQQWDALLDATPEDTELRQAYATWLQDEQDQQALADFQRWLAFEEKWATNRPLNPEEQGWCWYWSHEPVSEPAKHATLGPWALDHMPKVRWLFPSRQKAEEELFRAWCGWTEGKKPKKKGRRVTR
jgi:hypothetical protein